MESDYSKTKEQEHNISYKNNFAAGLSAMFPIAIFFSFAYLVLWRHINWTLPENLLEIPAAFLWGFLFPFLEKRFRFNQRLAMGLWGAILGILISVFWDFVIGLPYRQPGGNFKPVMELVIAPASGLFYFFTWSLFSAPIYRLTSHKHSPTK